MVMEDTFIRYTMQTGGDFQRCLLLRISAVIQMNVTKIYI